MSTQIILTTEEVNILTNSRNAKLKLEALEFAYDSAVQTINHAKRVLEFLSIALAIVFLYILYYLKDQSSPYHDFASIIGTGISLFVIILTIWRHVAKWDEQVEKKSELSDYIHKLVNQYNKSIEIRPVISANFANCNTDFNDFESRRKHSLATLRRYHIKLGHQHVAMKYPELEIKCNVCERTWNPSFAKRRKWTNIVPFFSCDGCGV